MLKHIKSLLKGKLFFIAIFITILIGYLSLMKVGKPLVHISHLDKVEHAIAYFVLCFSWLLAIKETRKSNEIKYLIVLGCICYGILIEVLQTTLTSYRTASSLDILANSVGVLLAMLIFNHFIEKKPAI